MIWGKPGAAKSQIVAQIAKADGYRLIDWRLCLMDAVDLRGVPEVRDGKTYWNPPAELPFDENEKVLIFMDEIMQAELQTTNASSQLILDRKLGSYTLPKNVRIIAASNRVEDRATAQRMPTHIANRFKHATLEVDAAEWIEWAKSANIDPRVRAFVKYRPKLLHVFDPASKEIAFASPRSYEFLSDTLRDLEASGDLAKMTPEEMVEEFSGNVGSTVAQEFVGFLQVMRTLVDIDEILLSPDKAAVPSDPSVLYALVYALLDRADAKTFKAIVKYINRIPQDFAYVLMGEVKKAKPVLMKTKDFIDWAVAHQDFVG
jgi:MoxR-like ATPase